MNDRSFAVILPAGGQSSRFGGPRNKLLEPLGGKPVILWALEAFLCRGDVVQVVIPASAGLLKELEGVLPADLRIRLCDGGPTRMQSVLRGLRAITAVVEWIAIHDAARPLVSQTCIDRTLAVAFDHGAAVPALPVHLTIKQAGRVLPSEVIRTVPRESLFVMQTPQIMRLVDLARASLSCSLPPEQITDDAQLLELDGREVWLAEGEQENLKITTALDLLLAEAILHSRSV